MRQLRTRCEERIDHDFPIICALSRLLFSAPVRISHDLTPTLPWLQVHINSSRAPHQNNL